MRQIDFSEPTSAEWKTWCKKCEKATEKIIAEVNSGAEDWKKNQKLYNKQKKVYFDKKGPFRHKCAYCETELRAHDDLDHFRPSKRVTSMDHKRIDHPGYYWLTNCWKNLLPACKDCNSPRGKGELKIGKGNRFPIRGFRAKNPGEEINEQPLLINPVEEDPEAHFFFHWKTKTIRGKTEKGRTCAKVFGFVEREELRQDWANAYDDVIRRIGSTYNPDVSFRRAKRRRLRKEIADGKYPHSLVRRAALMEIKI